MKEWGRTLLNALLSTLPVVIIIAILNLTGIARYNSIETIHGNGNTLFAVGAILLFVGIALFSIGTENAMSKIGEHVGATMTANKSLISLIGIVFLLGIFVTIAEPDLTVLASRIPVDNYVFIGLVGVGVGVFLVIGVMRILLQRSLKLWLMACYGLIFALACLVDECFIPITFDSGGVTTGPVTVPFILSLGVGIATSRAGKSSNADSFGLTAFCSVGPLIVVLIFGLVSSKIGLTYAPYDIADAGSTFFHSFTNSLRNVSIAMAPILLFFFIYNAVVIHLPKKVILKIIVGLVYTFVGLVLFLTGVEGGFSPIADAIGQTLVDRGVSQYWILLIVAAAIGLVVVLCEPAVQVLVKQVETISNGMIKKKTMLIALAGGIAAGVVLSIVRILCNFSLFYYVVPGYILALGLTFFVPDIYVGIAFDSGGVASGPMTSAFILPFAIGVAHKFYINNTAKFIESGVTEPMFLVTRAFGTVAMVAMMPLIVIQLLGISASYKRHHVMRVARERIHDANDNQIIHFGA